MGLGVRLVGQASKRGIIPRIPTGQKLLADVDGWLRQEYVDAVRGLELVVAPEAGAPASLSVALHPAARPLALTADDAGRVTGSAETSSVGPGYHTFVRRILERLGDELEILWAEPDPESVVVDDVSPAGAADRAAIERMSLAWLRASLMRVRAGRSIGRSGLQLGTTPGVRYLFEGAVGTALGPRDDDWLAQALDDPRVAIDVLPWWADATDARYTLNRALTLMWSEIRWRSPSSAEERAVADDVLALLHHAYPLDPSLPYPWAEWHELLELRGVDSPTSAFIAERASAAAADRPRIGYRREPVTVVHEGWQVEIPGSFAERRTAEEWWAGEGGRSITLAAVETGSGGLPMRAETFLATVAPDFGADALHHRDGPILGTGRLSTESRSGVSVGVLEGYSAVTGSGAAVRIEFDDPEDWHWALDLWRDLRPAGPDPTIDPGFDEIDPGRAAAEHGSFRGIRADRGSATLETAIARSA